ncbi:MAG: glycosyltransferase [Opitutaceae bacterium]
MTRFLLDLSHTSHTEARTGVQRVARELRRALDGEAVPVVFDPYERAWRRLDGEERRRLASRGASARRGARWSWRQACRGRVKRLLRGQGSTQSAVGSEPIAGAGGLIVPEIFSPRVAAALLGLRSRLAGPTVALFHDAIPLQRPEMSPASIVARFPAYLRELERFDGIAAISEESREALLAYWDWLGVRGPPVTAIPLGIPTAPSPPPPPAEPGRSPGLLCVSTLEGRKNHLALLDACESLWRRGVRFHVRLVGLARPETAAPALRRIDELRRAGRPLRYDGPVDDRRLESAYAEADFTVYPSIQEGFGLPVAESLARGRPCVCSGSGALGEIAREGGCLMLAALDAGAIAAACERLILDGDERARLAAEARGRRFRTPSEHARELLAWTKALPIGPR